MLLPGTSVLPIPDLSDTHQLRSANNSAITNLPFMSEVLVLVLRCPTHSIDALVQYLQPLLH